MTETDIELTFPKTVKITLFKFDGEEIDPKVIREDADTQTYIVPSGTMWLEDGNYFRVEAGRLLTKGV